MAKNKVPKRVIGELEVELEKMLCMKQGPIWGRLMKKNRGRKSHATVLLR
jgi:hypothetical protein